MSQQRATDVRLTVLGSGDAFSGCGCNAGYLLDSRVLVDCGAPAHVLSRRVGVSIRDLSLILLTHFHADHTFMLPLVLGALAFVPDPHRGPLIAGPPGTREYVSRLVTDGYGQHIQELLDLRLGPRYAVLQDGSDVELAGYRVRAHSVVHSLGPSLAYAISDSAGATIGFSGDSAMCAGLERAIRGCDLFVCECTGWGKPVPGGHLYSDEVAALMAAFPDVRFVISHLAQRRELRGALVAHDLLTLDVSPREQVTASS
ncbi:MAG: MBL fold metallo-hydrolase [Chloroflexi bacterium]|nr:MAG: MBL fold metallo-hydrolase [Chloroflexota bacterium]